VNTSRSWAKRDRWPPFTLSRPRDASRPFADRIPNRKDRRPNSPHFAPSARSTSWWGVAYDTESTARARLSVKCATNFAGVARGRRRWCRTLQLGDSREYRHRPWVGVEDFPCRHGRNQHGGVGNGPRRGIVRPFRSGRCDWSAQLSTSKKCRWAHRRAGGRCRSRPPG